MYEACSDQTPSAHPVGGADRSHLRGVPAVVSDLWRTDAHHRVHHLQRRHPAHPGAHRRRDRAASHQSNTWAVAEGQGCAWHCPSAQTSARLGELTLNKRTSRPNHTACDGHAMGHHLVRVVEFPIRQTNTRSMPLRRAIAPASLLLRPWPKRLECSISTPAWGPAWPLVRPPP